MSSSIDTSDEEGFQLVLSKKDNKQRKNQDKERNTPVVDAAAAYNNVRNMIVSMVSDTDPITAARLVPANELNDQELVKRAQSVFDEYNPEGFPPGKDGGPSMKRLLNLFTGSTSNPEHGPPKVRRYSVGTWKHAADNKKRQPAEMIADNIRTKQTKEVRLSPSLDMESSVSAWGDKQFAVSTIKKTTAERPQGSRQVKAPARLGHYTSGTKGIDTSIRASTVPKLVVHIDEDDDEDDSDKMCAGHIPLDKQKGVLVPGKYSLIRFGEVEAPRNAALSIADEEPVQARGIASNTANAAPVPTKDVVKDTPPTATDTASNIVNEAPVQAERMASNKEDAAPVPAKTVKDIRPTAKSFFEVGKGSGSTMHSSTATGTQDLVPENAGISDHHLVKRKRVASNATNRKVPRTELAEQATSAVVEASVDADARLQGHKGVLFYAFVTQRQLGRKIILSYLDPPVHEEGILENDNLSSDEFVLPPHIHDNHTLSRAEKDRCIDSVTRLQFIYLERHFFHRIYSSDDARLRGQDFTSDKHLFLVIIGGALTNSLWSLTNTFQMDKEKFIVALGHCDSRFGTFTVGFDKIPLSCIMLEHLLLLPIRTIMGYLHHHGVSYRSIPWEFKAKQPNRSEDDVLTGLQTMPVDTAPPFAQLTEFLAELMTYLNTVMRNEEDSYAIIYTQFRLREKSSLTHRDAAAFVQHHFPLEASRLRGDSSHYNLLVRAMDFSFDIYHVGDIKENCSHKWMVFIHYLMYGLYPPAQGEGYDTEQCIKALLKLNIDQDDEEPPDLRRLLSGPAHLMTSFLKTTIGQSGCTARRSTGSVKGSIALWYRG